MLKHPAKYKYKMIYLFSIAYFMSWNLVHSWYNALLYKNWQGFFGHAAMIIVYDQNVIWQVFKVAKGEGEHNNFFSFHFISL